MIVLDLDVVGARDHELGPSMDIMLLMAYNLRWESVGEERSLKLREVHVDATPFDVRKPRINSVDLDVDLR